MISLFSAALLATVFAASCGKTLATCAEAKDEATCNEAKSFSEGVYCEWNATATPAVCVDSPSKKAAAELAADTAKCAAVTELDNDTACKAVKLTNDAKECKYTPGTPASGSNGAVAAKCEISDK